MPTSIFNITGPITIGPSSSHTAGAVRIGNVARNAAGAPIRHAAVTFYGSFAKTYKGHGTDLAVIGGLLGLDMADPDIKNSLQLASQRDMTYEFRTASDPRYHPNTVCIDAKTDINTINLRASSIGGGAIMLDYMNGYAMGITCSFPTLIVPHADQPGMIASISNILALDGCNIASMKLSRAKRGGSAVVVFETDTIAEQKATDKIKMLPGVTGIIFIPKV